MSKKESGLYPPEEFEEIHVTSYFHKGLGRRVYAREYGKKCFVLRVRVRRKPYVPVPRD